MYYGGTTEKEIEQRKTEQAQTALRNISSWLSGAYFYRSFCDNIYSIDDKIHSLLSDKLAEKSSKSETLAFCEKVFAKDASHLYTDDVITLKCLKKMIPEILVHNIENELSHQNVKGAFATLKTLNNIINKSKIKDSSLAIDFAQCLVKCQQPLRDEVYNSMMRVWPKGDDGNDMYLGSDFTKACLSVKPNMQQQLIQTWQNTSGSEFDYGCLKGVQELIENNQADCLNIVSMFPRLPVYRFDANSLKMAYSVLDAIADKKPNLKHKVLDVVEWISQSPNNNKASQTKAQSLLYHIAQKYPETKDRIEEFTGRKIEQLAPHSNAIPDQEFIFMGYEKPCAEKFKEIYTKRGLGLKFRGGLWTSPKTANGHSEWYNWKKFEDDSPEEQTAYYVEPKKDCRCLVIQSLEDIEPYKVKEKWNDSLDVNALKKDYDCIYVEDPHDDKFNLCLDGWDVSTLVILKADKFNAYTEEEWQTHKRITGKIKHSNDTNSKSSGERNKNIPDHLAYIKGLISLEEYYKR